MSRDDPQMKIRLPAELKTGVETAAKANNRTMNAEIVARLQQSFENKLLSQGDMEVLEQSAQTLGLVPGTQEFKDAIQTLSEDVQTRMKAEASKEVQSLLAMARMKREAPDLFMGIVNAGIKGGRVPTKPTKKPSP